MADTILQNLAAGLAEAGGGDGALDQQLAVGLGQPAADYTQSVPACQGLTASLLPGWHLHLGYDARGLFPYAALSWGTFHVEATAPTVPLAILRALVNALLAADIQVPSPPPAT